MYDMYLILLTTIGTVLATLLFTPVVKRIARKEKVKSINVNNTQFSHRDDWMPSMGGLAIFIPYYIILFFFTPVPYAQVIPIFLGSLVVLMTGMLDDVYDLKPWIKIIGIIIGASVTYFFGDIALTSMNIPLIGTLEFGSFAFPLTVIWILGFTNAMNLIDGLDGLATGISMIGLTTMGIIGFFFLTIEEVSISVMIFILVAAIAGFWPYNFQPASIFLGDTGALFLGFMIGVFSLEGLKNASLISFILPIIILGIPITDTLYAIIRRKLNRQPLRTKDMHHIHNRLMSLGLSHRQTVLAIYCLSGIFSIIALLYNFSTLVGGIILTISLLLGVELFVEIIELVGEKRRPLLKAIRRLADNINRK